MACRRCGKCCREYCVAMSKDAETARFLGYHGLTMRNRDDGLMEIFGTSKCLHLRTSKEFGSSCAIYATRPAICSEFLCDKAR